MDCVRIAEKHFFQSQPMKSKSKNRPAVVWTRPRGGWWKVNVDAAVKQGVGTGIGVVV